MKNGVTVLPTLLHSKSRGTIRLQSSDPNDPPLIDPQFLSHPDDVKILVEGQSRFLFYIYFMRLQKLSLKLWFFLSVMTLSLLSLICFVAIRITEKLGNTKMFEILGAKRQVRIHPACQGHSYDSSAYWECYIRHNTMTLNQPAGTCKMGSASDSSTVVDSQLR